MVSISARPLSAGVLTSLLVLAIGACGGDGFDEPDGDADMGADLADWGGDGDPFGDDLLDNPLSAFPELLTEVGLYTALPDRTVVDSRAIEYIPRYQLWSNGSLKERYIVLPAGSQIDTTDPTSWEFPDGTLFFKTFSYRDEDFPDGRPIETRIIRRNPSGWDLALYQWNESGTDAELLDMTTPVRVGVETSEAGAFEHEIPSRLQCRTCHEADPNFIIGFDELRLTNVLEGAEATQLEALDAAGLLQEPVRAEPEVIEADDELTATVLGYMHGNCAHCHNGFLTATAQFDLRHSVFLENTIDQETQSSGMAAGIRIVPGEPDESILFLSFSGEGDIDGVADMPPAGVQVRDQQAIEMLRSWIETLADE